MKWTTPRRRTGHLERPRVEGLGLAGVCLEWFERFHPQAVANLGLLFSYEGIIELANKSIGERLLPDVLNMQEARIG